MLSFKDLKEVLQPKAAGEKRFKDKHVADTIDYPLNDAEINKGTKKSPAKKKRIADSEEGKDAAVYEENDDEMTPAQEKKREEIVMAMKKDKEKLQSRYGESWKAVMYATATKQAMSEEVELEEALNPKDKKVVDAFYDGKSMDGKMLSTDGKKLEKTGMGGQTIASKSGNKFKIVAKMDSKSTQDVVKYIEKSFPKNVIEEVELDEALPPHLAKYIGKDGDFTPEVKKRLGKDFMKRMQVPSKKKSNVKDVTPKGYGPNEELDESAAGIAQLKKAYEPLRDKKISLDNAKKLSAIMDKFADDKAMLIKLVKADIPFVSSKAVTILITKHNMKGAEINKMRKEGNAFGMALKAAKEKGDKTFVVAGVTYEVYESADLDEAFKISATNQKLNDGSMVNISKDDASALNGLYNSLNSANAKTMSKKMMQDKKSYGEILAFAKQAM